MEHHHLSGANELSELVHGYKKSILEIGFKNTANIHSVSDTAKLGGKVGWISDSQLNETIKKEIINLKHVNALIRHPRLFSKNPDSCLLGHLTKDEH